MSKSRRVHAHRGNVLWRVVSRGQSRRAPENGGARGREAMGTLVRCPKCTWRTDASRVTCPNCGTALPTPEESRAREAAEQARQIAPNLTDEQRQRIIEEERLHRQEERLRQHLRECPEANGSAARGQVRGGEMSSEKPAMSRTTWYVLGGWLGLMFLVGALASAARVLGPSELVILLGCAVVPIALCYLGAWGRMSRTTWYVLGGWLGLMFLVGALVSAARAHGSEELVILVAVLDGAANVLGWAVVLIPLCSLGAWVRRRRGR
jgi:preprotein translocase subunit SecG/ribosomal protein S27E